MKRVLFALGAALVLLVGFLIFSDLVAMGDASSDSSAAQTRVNLAPLLVGSAMVVFGGLSALAIVERQDQLEN